MKTYSTLGTTTLPKKKTFQHSPPGHAAGSVEATIGRVGESEQDEARPASSAPRGGPHLKLARLRLKTWYDVNFQDVESRPPESSYIHARTAVYSLWTNSVGWRYWSAQAVGKSVEISGNREAGVKKTLFFLSICLSLTPRDSQEGQHINVQVNTRRKGDKELRAQEK